MVAAAVRAALVSALTRRSSLWVRRSRCRPLARQHDQSYGCFKPEHSSSQCAVSSRSAEDLHVPRRQIHPELRRHLLLLYHVTDAEVGTQQDVYHRLALRVDVLECRLEMGVGDRYADITTAYVRERLAREPHTGHRAVVQIAHFNRLRSDEAHECLTRYIALQGRSGREGDHRLVLLLPAQRLPLDASEPLGHFLERRT